MASLFLKSKVIWTNIKILIDITFATKTQLRQTYLPPRAQLHYHQTHQIPSTRIEVGKGRGYDEHNQQGSLRSSRSREKLEVDRIIRTITLTEASKPSDLLCQSEGRPSKNHSLRRPLKSIIGRRFQFKYVPRCKDFMSTPLTHSKVDLWSWDTRRAGFDACSSKLDAEA